MISDVVFSVGVVLVWLSIVAIGLVPSVKRRVLTLLNSKPNQANIVILVLSLLAMGGSLWYSEVVGYNPCKLCWYQRIFMYPIVLLSFIAAVRRDLGMVVYIRAMAIVGLVISTYHVIEQRLPQVGLTCGVTTDGESCSTTWVNVLDLISIPMMAGTIFAAIILTTLLAERAQSPDFKISTNSD